MKRLLKLVGLASLMLSVCSAHGGPERGQYRSDKDNPPILQVGQTLEFRETFRANERACVIVEGDHNPVMNLKVVVSDLAGNPVASDQAGGDFVVVTWYPPRTQQYVIRISGDGNQYNVLDIVMK